MSDIDIGRVRNAFHFAKGPTDGWDAVVAEVGRQISYLFDQGGWTDHTAGYMAAKWTSATKKIGVCHRSKPDVINPIPDCVGCGHPWAIHDYTIGCIACDYIVSKRA